VYYNTNGGSCTNIHTSLCVRKITTTPKSCADKCANHLYYSESAGGVCSCSNSLTTKAGGLGIYERQSGGITQCTSCAKGTYNSETGKSSCTQCAAGKYNPNTMQTQSGACTDCIGGTSAESSGSPGCRTCTIATYAAIGSRSCTTCPAGKHGNAAGQSSCTNCLVSDNKYSRVGATQCGVCGQCYRTDASGANGIGCTEPTDYSEWKQKSGANPGAALNHHDDSSTPGPHWLSTSMQYTSAYYDRCFEFCRDTYPGIINGFQIAYLWQAQYCFCYSTTGSGTRGEGGTYTFLVQNDCLKFNVLNSLIVLA